MATPTKEKILIVEDLFVEAHTLQRILEMANYEVYPICSSVGQALGILKTEVPDFVMLDIYLKGPETGIDLGHILNERGIPFIYISANSDETTLEKAKVTSPFGFLVKPFKEKDVLVTLAIARYHFQNNFKRLAQQHSPATHQIDFTNPVIGRSKLIQETLDMDSVVASAETSVLLLGESGTGKEVIAQRIHDMSARHDKALIKVNCASIPENLIESELFGHERGAFSGASEMRKGKFERADGGTIFLDEIGELPYKVQSKLLRVLQEREFERVGSNKPLKTDVRIIAATNRNLHKEVADMHFRLDLFYRLNVFPITLPPLRERKEDIKPLVHHFVAKFSRRLGRSIYDVDEKAFRDLIDYHWPGNVRELENVIERTVIMTTGNRINKFIMHNAQSNELGDNKAVKSLVEMERDHILYVLHKCNGKIFGPNGAAQMLKLKVSTLNYRIKKLGIEKSK